MRRSKARDESGPDVREAQNRRAVVLEDADKAYIVEDSKAVTLMERIADNLQKSPDIRKMIPERVRIREDKALGGFLRGKSDFFEERGKKWGFGF